jgi:hypothetical protein
MKPWTWKQLSKIERERGPKFTQFLKDYGLRGALALELTRGDPCLAPSETDIEDCAIAVWAQGKCEKCPAFDIDPCESWKPAGLKNLNRRYREALEDEGRLPNG